MPKREEDIHLRLSAKRKAFVEKRMWMADKAANWAVHLYRAWAMGHDEAWSDAVYWLMKCACRWSPKRGVKFSTYYVSCWKWWMADIGRGRYSKWHSGGHRQFGMVEDNKDDGEAISQESIVPDRRPSHVEIRMDLEQAHSVVKWKRDWELHLEGKTQRQIGEILGLSKARCGQRLAENLALVQRFLRDYHIQPLKGKQGRRS